MPEVVKLKRAGRRSGGTGFRLRRWFYRNRPAIAVIVAFGVMVLIGLVFVSLSVSSLSSGGGGETEATYSAPQ